jgi:hypothetical protein
MPQNFAVMGWSRPEKFPRRLALAGWPGAAKLLIFSVGKADALSNRGLRLAERRRLQPANAAPPDVSRSRVHGEIVDDGAAIGVRIVPDSLERVEIRKVFLFVFSQR